MVLLQTLETVSAKSSINKHLFECVGGLADTGIEDRLDFVSLRRYVRNKASHPALPAECRMRKPRFTRETKGQEAEMSTATLHGGGYLGIGHHDSRSARGARAVQPRLRLTARGRSVLTTLAALPLVVAAFAFALNGGGATASLNGSEVAFDFVTVQSGESLWGIAEQVAPTTDPRDVIYDIMKLNGLESAEVYAGQELAIPAEYAD
jgi:hypothetical protein